METFINAVIGNGIFEETSKGNYLFKDCHFFFRQKNRSFLAERDNKNGSITDWTIVFRSGDETIFEKWAEENMPDNSSK
jgi:hypothetical protein